MALVDCPECAKPISSEAYVCPNCGYPTAKQRKAAIKPVRTLILWVILIVAFLVIWQFLSPK